MSSAGTKASIVPLACMYAIGQQLVPLYLPPEHDHKPTQQEAGSTPDCEQMLRTRESSLPLSEIKTWFSGHKISSLILIELFRLL
jgi:hypothetical protein